MKALALILLLISPLAFAAQMSPPESAALKFNEWYVANLSAEKSPLDDIDSLKPYVAADTLKALNALYAGDSNDKDMPDADPFIKAQDYSKDWHHVSVLMSELDPVCTNVYIAFGKKNEHVVADCMIEESGKWKIRSATLIRELP
jgi:hypothetical protein